MDIYYRDQQHCFVQVSPVQHLCFIEKNSMKQVIMQIDKVILKQN